LLKEQEAKRVEDQLKLI